MNGWPATRQGVDWDTTGKTSSLADIHDAIGMLAECGERPDRIVISWQTWERLQGWRRLETWRRGHRRTANPRRKARA